MDEPTFLTKDFKHGQLPQPRDPVPQRALRKGFGAIGEVKRRRFRLWGLAGVAFLLLAWMVRPHQPPYLPQGQELLPVAARYGFPPIVQHAWSVDAPINEELGRIRRALKPLGYTESSIQEAGGTTYRFQDPRSRDSFLVRPGIGRIATGTEPLGGDPQEGCLVFFDQTAESDRAFVRLQQWWARRQGVHNQFGFPTHALVENP